MRANGWQGVNRAKKVRTTVADPEATRPPDLVDRQFHVFAPNMLVVADFTYVRLATGVFVYTAFAVDAFAGRIVGWQCSVSKHTAFVGSAIRQAANLRWMDGNPLTGSTIHHADAGSQYTSVRFGETLMLAGLKPSVGSVGDCLRQRSGRDHDGALQDRGRTGRLTVSRGPAAPAGRRRAAHRRLGRLVQRQPTSCTASAAYPRWSSRRPTTLNRRPPRRRHTSNRVCTKPARNPGRINLKPSVDSYRKRSSHVLQGCMLTG